MLISHEFTIFPLELGLDLDSISNMMKDMGNPVLSESFIEDLFHDVPRYEHGYHSFNMFASLGAQANDAAERYGYDKAVWLVCQFQTSLCMVLHGKTDWGQYLAQDADDFDGEKIMQDMIDKSATLIEDKQGDERPHDQEFGELFIAYYSAIESFHSAKKISRFSQSTFGDPVRFYIWETDNLDSPVLHRIAYGMANSESIYSAQGVDRLSAEYQYDIDTHEKSFKGFATLSALVLLAESDNVDEAARYAMNMEIPLRAINNAAGHYTKMHMDGHEAMQAHAVFHTFAKPKGLKMMKGVLQRNLELRAKLDKERPRYA